MLLLGMCYYVGMMKLDKEKELFNIYKDAFNKAFNVDISHKTRTERVVLPRHLFRWCLYMEGLSKNKIAKLSECNHATIIHSINYVANWIKINPDEVNDMIYLAKDEIATNKIIEQSKKQYKGVWAK